LLHGWVWVLWVLTGGLSGSGSRDVVSEGSGVSGVFGISSLNIGGLCFLESLLGLDNISSLLNLLLEKSSGISWSPGFLTEGLHVVDVGEGVVVVMVVSGRNAKESHKNNGVFHFSLIISKYKTKLKLPNIKYIILKNLFVLD